MCLFAVWTVLLLSALTCGVTHWKLEKDGIVAMSEPRVFTGDTNDVVATTTELSKDNHETIFSLLERRFMSSSQNCASNSMCQQQCTCRKMTEVAETDDLACKEHANETAYDFLEGVAMRQRHKAYPEPEVAMIFKKEPTDNSIDLTEVEASLQKAIKQTPNSTGVYNQIGNYWRIKGNTYLAIECFRKALSISPNNADVLLNLARVLFNLRYLQDAIFLTKHSLGVKPAGQSGWLQHFTLGEVYKSSGEYDRATEHFKKVLELNPPFHPAEVNLRELGMMQESSVNIYTVLIILCLIGLVLAIIHSMVSHSIQDKGKRRSA